MDSAELNSDQDIVNFKLSAESAGASAKPLLRIREMLRTVTKNLDSRFIAGEPIELLFVIAQN
jgi:hypothetical protein